MAPCAPPGLPRPRWQRRRSRWSACGSAAPRGGRGRLPALSSPPPAGTALRDPESSRIVPNRPKSSWGAVRGVGQGNGLGEGYCIKAAGGNGLQPLKWLFSPENKIRSDVHKLMSYRCFTPGCGWDGAEVSPRLRLAALSTLSIFLSIFPFSYILLHKKGFPSCRSLHCPPRQGVVIYTFFLGGWGRMFL